jgi:hypothetical protein
VRAWRSCGFCNPLANSPRGAAIDWVRCPSSEMLMLEEGTYRSAGRKWLEMETTTRSHVTVNKRKLWHASYERLAF